MENTERDSYLNANNKEASKVADTLKSTQRNF